MARDIKKPTSSHPEYSYRPKGVVIMYPARKMPDRNKQIFDSCGIRALNL
jgi:hypothetical protein